MTHNYLHDLEFLKTLLPSPVRYLSVLGSKNRTERLLQDLLAGGMATYTEEQLSRLYGPAGIDIGADTPEEIALAIVAEIQAVLANRTGGLLRDRKGPIHHRLDGSSNWSTCKNSHRVALVNSKSFIKLYLI